jgi:hypothetical protein
MPVKFSPSTRKFIKGKGKTFEYEHDYIKHKSKEDLIKYLNEGQKPKVKRKCLIELDRRKIKLVWVKKEPS